MSTTVKTRWNSIRIVISSCYVALCISSLPGHLLAQSDTSDTNIASVNPGEIRVTGDSFLFIAPETADLEFSIASSSSSFSEARLTLLRQLKKVQELSKWNPKLKNSSVDSGSIDIQKGSPIRIEETYSMLSIPLAELPKIQDLLLNWNNIKILQTVYRSEKAGLNLEKAYSEAFARAESKAKNLATKANRKLGNIYSIDVSEEPLPESLRAQLNRSDGNISSGAKELNIFVTVQYQLE